MSFGLRTEVSYLGGDATAALTPLRGVHVLEEPLPAGQARPWKKPKAHMLAFPYYDVGAGVGGLAPQPRDEDLSEHDGTTYTMTKKGSVC